MRRDIVFRIFPMADPDGVVLGGVRYNQNGYDLNRNWDLHDPVRMPEIAAQKSAVRKWLEAGRRIDLFLTLHNTESSEYITGLPESAPSRQRKVLAEFDRRLREETDFSPSRQPEDPGISTTPGKPGRVSVYQAMVHEFGIAGFLMEQRVQHNPKLGRVPLAEDRIRFGRQLARACGAAVR